MLERLTIRDLALVEGAEMEFGRGLTAVTGETGAGKSLTVEALALVVGGRADADIVREGAKACVVEAEFRAEAARLRQADRLRELASLALERLSDGEHAAVVSAGAARHAIEQAAALDPSLADALAELDQTVIAAQESARTLGGYLGRLEADPERLETVEARRDLYARLTRKYRRSLPELI